MNNIAIKTTRRKSLVPTSLTAIPDREVLLSPHLVRGAVGLTIADTDLLEPLMVADAVASGQVEGVPAKTLLCTDLRPYSVARMLLTSQHYAGIDAGMVQKNLTINLTRPGAWAIKDLIAEHEPEAVLINHISAGEDLISLAREHDCAIAVYADAPKRGASYANTRRIERLDDHILKEMLPGVAPRYLKLSVIDIKREPVRIVSRIP